MEAYVVFALPHPPFMVVLLPVRPSQKLVLSSLVLRQYLVFVKNVTGFKIKMDIGIAMFADVKLWMVVIAKTSMAIATAPSNSTGKYSSSSLLSRARTRYIRFAQPKRNQEPADR